MGLRDLSLRGRGPARNAVRRWSMGGPSVQTGRGHAHHGLRKLGRWTYHWLARGRSRSIGRRRNGFIGF